MLWTVFMILMAVWMLKMVLDFGGSAIPIVLVVSLAALAAAADDSPHLLQLRRTARPQEDRKVQLHSLSNLPAPLEI